MTSYHFLMHCWSVEQRLLSATRSAEVLRFAVEQRRSDAAAALLRAGAWAKELEKDSVLSLLREQGLLRCLDRSCGRGVGVDAREHERLVAAALGAELPADMFPSPMAVVA